MPDNHLIDSLTTGLKTTPNKVFAYRAGSPDVTFHALFDGAGRMASALVANGLTVGGRVAVQVEKTVEALQLYLATVMAGGVFLPLNVAYTPKEVAYFLGDATPDILVCDPARKAALSPHAQGARVLTLDAAGQTDFGWHDLPALAPVARGPNDLAAILYTSGTTGRSKGAMLSHRNLASNSQTLKDYWRFTSDDVLIHALPIFHTHGLFVATNVALMAGASIRFMPRFDAEAVIAAMPVSTAMMGVPTFYTRLLADPRLTPELTRAFRLFVSGSAPLLASTHRDWEARTGHRILERYGMTETNMNTSNPYDGDRRAGTVGFPLPGVELRVMRDGQPQPANEIGVIEVRGDNVFQGYWQMPEKTAEELRPDGWFITGDQGFVDDDGYVTIVGREKDMIISGGFNVYPKEVEAVIDAHPAVKESAVIGVPHPDMGEGVVAVVVPAQPGLDQEELQSLVAESLARFKQPRVWHIVEDLPRNTMGKVQKKALRETYRDDFAKQ